MPDIDNTPLTFGRHKGHTPQEILRDDPNYLIWLYENILPIRCSKRLYECAWEAEDDYYDCIDMYEYCD